MANPPFNIDESTPGDSDIVSQFPAAERTFRDVVESWIKVDHNVQGRHAQVSLDFSSDPPGTASVTKLWADSAGALRFRVGTGNAAYVIPPGTVVDYAGSTAPEGWLLCYGQAVSRTTYAALFAAIGTTYGAGDGSTTFNLPDAQGRVVAGKDDMGGSAAGRLTGQSGGVDGTTLGAVGGAETHTLTEAELASHTHTISDPGHSHQTAQQGKESGPEATGVTTASGTDSPGDWKTASATTGITVNAAGGDQAHNNVQPTLVLNKIIKY